jgi:tetratricopeptide (TPR) repeat protein
MVLISKKFCYFFKEEYNLALEISNKCIEIDYNYYESYLTKAKIFLKLENKSEAIKDFIRIGWTSPYVLEKKQMNFMLN